jgi:hypothetical protein
MRSRAEQNENEKERIERGCSRIQRINADQYKPSHFHPRTSAKSAFIRVPFVTYFLQASNPHAPTTLVCVPASSLCVNAQAPFGHSRLPSLYCELTEIPPESTHQRGTHANRRRTLLLTRSAGGHRHRRRRASHQSEAIGNAG